MTTDPAVLAEKLVSEAPASRAKDFDHLELEATRWLMSEMNGDEFEKAMTVVRRHLAEILDVPVPDRSIQAERPAARSAATAPDLVAQAKEIIASTFSTPFDGSEERLEVLALRAKGSCKRLLSEGLSEETCDALICENVSELRAAYSPYR